MHKQALLLLYIVILSVLPGCKRSHTTETHPPSNAADSAEIVTQDKFRIIKDHTCYRSGEMEHDEYDGDYYYYSQQNVNIQWPEQLAGCKDLTQLHKALLTKGFSKEFLTADIDSSVQKFTKSALFLEFGENLTAVPVTESDIKEGMNSLFSSIIIQKFLTSPTLIGFSINKSDYLGGAHGYHSLEHLIYDKTNCTIVDSAYVFAPEQHNHLIGTINHHILKKGEKYILTDKIPDFYIDTENVIFVFQPYEITSYSEGIIKIRIPYAELEQMMTPRFKKLLKEAGQIQIDQEYKKRF